MRGFFLTTCFIFLPKQKYSPKTCICSDNLTVYRKVKPFYNERFYTDQPQTIGGLFVYPGVVIKSANSFHKDKFNKKRLSKTIKTLIIINSLSVLLSALVWNLCVGKDVDFKFCDSVDSNNVGFKFCDSVDSVFCFHTQLSLILAMWFDYLCISCNGKSTNHRSCELVYCTRILEN